MKTCTKCNIFKELTEFNKRVELKDGLRTECKICSRLMAANRARLNPGRGAEANRKWRANNPERELANNKKYRERNPGYKARCKAKARAVKKQRTPKWLTKEHNDQIKEFYKQSAELQKQTGIEHNVDHIIPLQGKTVSGLHVPWNLRVMVAKGPGGNYSKGNKLLEIEKDQQASPL